VALSDDGRPVATSLLMRRVLEYTSMFGMPVIDHCEDPALKADGVAHEGPTAARLGLRGIPGIAEELMIERDVTIAGYTGGTVHIAHLSTAGSLRAVRSGKERAVRVTCEVTPHHFVLTDEALEQYDTNTKMNPPLREAADRDALVRGLADGSVDVIATDHAPHHYDEKNVEYDRAPFGIVGLETAVSLTFDRLVHAGHIGVSRMVELLSVNPARILNVPGGTLSPGAPADITILAPDLVVTVDPARFRSRSRNTPFGGWTLRGGVGATIVGGRMVYVNEGFGL
jgi:dihydroorotase